MVRALSSSDGAVERFPDCSLQRNTSERWRSFRDILQWIYSNTLASRLSLTVRCSELRWANVIIDDIMVTWTSCRAKVCATTRPRGLVRDSCLGLGRHILGVFRALFFYKNFAKYPCLVAFDERIQTSNGERKAVFGLYFQGQERLCKICKVC